MTPDSAPGTSANRLLRAAAQAIALLTREKNLELSIRQALEIVGTATDADRSYFWRCFYDEHGAGRASQIIEWNSGHATPQVNNPDLQDVPFTLVDSFVRPLLEDTPLIGLVRDLPEDSRAYLEPQGIVAIIAMPIRVRDELWGFVGFDECNDEHEWSEDEQSILLSFAASIASAAERSIADAENRRALDNANAANRTKEAFIANVSHEIRTPLNAMVGYAELMLAVPDKTRHAEYLRGLKTAGHVLLSLINNILDLATMEHAQIVLSPERVQLAPLIEELTLVFRPQLESKDLSLTMDVDQSLPDALVADALRLRQILYNLTANAIKFTHRGSVSILLTGTEEKEGHIDLRVVVSDTGIGIAEENRKNIFDPFFQAEDHERRQYQGTGLGLSITKRLVELMGGRIAVRSSMEPGATGTAFQIDLPGMRVAQEQMDGTPTLSWAFKDTRVLVVDDIEVNRVLMEGFLRSAGIRTLEAADGKTALSLARIERPDLILLDVQMPEMTGMEVLQELKQDPLTRSMPVVIVTASTIGKSTSDLQELADGFLYKPLTRYDLITEVARHLHGRRQEHQVPRNGPGDSPGHTKSTRFEPFANADTVKKRFLVDWQRVNELQSIDDIAHFAEKVSRSAIETGDSALKSWADALSDQCAAFELEALEKTFGLFLRLTGTPGNE